MILIIGSEEEYHSKYMYDLLKSKREDVCYFDTRLIPQNLLINWCPSSRESSGFLETGKNRINLKDIKSVYWRWYYGIKIPPANNNPDSVYISQMIERESISAVESLFASIDCLWVNSISAIEMHRKKSYQLYLMAKNGIRVPNTLITNTDKELKAFLEANNGEIIYKPVRGGAHTEKLRGCDFTEERLASLKYSPVQFQEFIDGVDIRVYVVKDKIFAAEIQAKTVDFRDDPNARLIPVELPENVKQDCLKIMPLLGLNFSGIDIRQCKTGEYVFIEANPSPMFTFFEQKTHHPISENLAELLIKG